MGTHLNRTKLGAVLAAAALSLAVTACGHEEKTEVVEGEPLELNELRYNVSITRFLNPTDVEDAAYLTEQPPPPTGKDYLGVFISIENEADRAQTLPDAEDIEVVDTTGEHYEPIESENPFALDLGSTIEAHAEVPADDTVARGGPTQGALILFLTDEEVSENRPLELEIKTQDGRTGLIELDI